MHRSETLYLNAADMDFIKWNRYTAFRYAAWVSSTLKYIAVIVMDICCRIHHLFIIWSSSQASLHLLWHLQVTRFCCLNKPLTTCWLWMHLSKSGSLSWAESVGSRWPDEAGYLSFWLPHAVHAPAGKHMTHASAYSQKIGSICEMFTHSAPGCRERQLAGSSLGQECHFHWGH